MTRSEKIIGVVTTWNNITTAPHRFGGIEFRFNKRELGHLHGNSLLDIPFPMNVRNELVRSGRVQQHHVLPESGWISFYLRSDEDVSEAVELLRMSYELAAKQYSQRQQNAHPTAFSNSRTNAAEGI
jgi:hypothetical protein